ncbi:hypothetical protein NVS55_36280 [Myxococcus stipitatus]|uniref:hypothetical protein n=1 Tax=Myxococcus stipitatus TaxID=83455 RepID=UPI0031454E42
MSDIEPETLSDGHEGVAGVTTSKKEAKGYFSMLKAQADATKASIQALPGALIYCAKGVSIRGRVAFENGATGPVEVSIEGRAPCIVTPEAPTYSFVWLASGEYTVTVRDKDPETKAYGDNQIGPSESQVVTLEREDVANLDFTVTRIARTFIQWKSPKPIKQGDSLQGLLEAWCVRKDDVAKRLAPVPIYTYSLVREKADGIQEGDGQDSQTSLTENSELLPGRYWLTAQLDDKGCAQLGQNVLPPKPMRVELVVLPLFAIRGTVRFVNFAKPDLLSARIRINGGSDVELKGSESRYEFMGLLKGTYTLSVDILEPDFGDHGFVPETKREVSVETGDVGDVDFVVTFIAETEIAELKELTLEYGALLSQNVPADMLRRKDKGGLVGSQEPALKIAKALNSQDRKQGKTLSFGDASGPLMAGQYEVMVAFDLKGTNLKDPVSKTFPVTVNRALPAIELTHPITVEYGEAAERILERVAPRAMHRGSEVPGRFEWESFKELPGMGEHSRFLKFTPTDSANCRSVSGVKCVIQVVPRRLEFKWAQRDQPSLKHGDPLPASCLAVTVVPPVSSRFVFKMRSGGGGEKQTNVNAELEGGECELIAEVTLTAADQKLYRAEEIRRSLKVSPTDQIQLAVDAAKEVKSGSQLVPELVNPMASFKGKEVKGTFFYSLADGKGLGTSLEPGEHVVTVRFDPTTKAHFNAPADITVTLPVVRVTEAERRSLGIDVHCERHVLHGEVVTRKDEKGHETYSLQGGHMPSLAERHPVTATNKTTGVRTIELSREHTGADGRKQTLKHSSSVPPAGWTDDMFWDATRQTLGAPGTAETTDSGERRIVHDANVKQPGKPTRPDVPWRVITTGDGKTVITSFPR